MNVVYNIDEIKNAAAIFLNHLANKKLIAFHGEMGAGKTTFIHALCEIWQVQDAVSSPTFAIINEYESETAGIIFHMDWYRIKSDEEARQAGIEDCLDSGNICLIEWPENAENLLPEDTLHVFIETVDEQKRSLTIV
jgi:tRNA threonylcarbamoyladenosine biosynthesis protein TsaE